ncbi:hypothetical protein TOPH_03962 [Tolypocladium ophioglossoides CBS 100239]|uniref:C2H2-type domain-containing protein n=1 Tax=Tolypocladium ophioglossoides (strain CBS 100239) TaxID=1163406 RepID=A0A0L0NBR2_TOLOC|nr:hypothetical protein TOPH_03962 [Tolypocladium ophioglossoides CBS 100239]
MKLRVAREGHRRLPLTQADRDAAFEEWLRRGDAKIEQRERERQLAEEPATGDDDTDAAGDACDAGDTGESNVEKKLRRWGIRDWSDVVGAAALAGFSEDVIKRTTRRCANLFGQGMVIRRLDEVPHSRGAGFHTMDYQPERIRLAPSSPSSDDDLNPAPTLPQRRLASLASSASPRGRPSAAASRSVSRSRSRSRSSAGLLFCPLATCDRATTGFSRRSNLRRHMKLVHPGHAGEEHDSEDEAVGAVHVDGFLRTIQVARGWRGEDAVERRRKRSWGGRPIHSGSRSRAQSDGDGDDEEAGDESS